MIEQIDGFLTEFIDGRYCHGYERIGPLSLRYNVRDIDVAWTNHPLKDKSLKNRLNGLGVSLKRIMHNTDSETQQETSVEFHFELIQYQWKKKKKQ